MLIIDMVADIRLRKDIRVTNTTVNTVSQDTVSQSLDYNKTNISDVVTLPYESSSITYQVEITNIENAEMGIYDLTLSNPNLDYTINNYTKKNKLCDDKNNLKCNLGSVSTISVTISYKANMYDSENIEQAFILDFDFRGFYTITYTDIVGNYQSTIMDGETLQVNFGQNAIDRIMVSMGGIRLTLGEDYTYSNGVLTLSNVDNYIEIGPFVTPASCFTSTARAQISNYICADTDVVIPSNLMLQVNGTGTAYKVTSIGGNAFKDKGLTSVVISDDITSIGGSAFQNNLLTSIEIPDSVMGIGSYAFRYNKLTSIEIPDSVTSVEVSAFDANSLTTVKIGNGLTSISPETFRNTTGTRTKYDGTTITYGPNRVTSVIINNSAANVSGYASYTFGWAPGYSNSNICWLLDNPNSPNCSLN